jgi:hypothetical protein
LIWMLTCWAILNCKFVICEAIGLTYEKTCDLQSVMCEPNRDF